MPYRLIAVDLDNTLLDDDSQISVRNKKAIRKAVNKGVKFVIATGRMFKTSLPFMQELKLNNDFPIINYHGALIKSSGSHKILLHRPLPNKLAIEVVDAVEKMESHISLFVNDKLYIKEENEVSSYFQAKTSISMRPVGQLSMFLKQKGINPSKISIICWDGRIDEIETKLNELFGDKFSMLQSQPFFLEITDRKATKGQALSWLTAKEGIRAEEVIAFGDGFNDLDMVEFAGLGVAVANARPEVLRAANLVTAANNEDGDGEAIEKYILN